MHRSRAALLSAVAVTLLLAASACSSDGGDGTTTTGEGSATTSAGDSTTTTGGGGAGDETPPTTVADGEAARALDDLAAVLNDGDLGCDTVEGQRAADGAQGAAQCDLDTDNPAYLYTFDDNEQRDAFIDNGGVIDCTFIFGSDITFDYVVADGVIIRPEDNVDADALAAAVDGEVRSLSCELPEGEGDG